MCLTLVSKPKNNKKNKKPVAKLSAPRNTIRGKGDYQSILNAIQGLGRKLIPEGAFRKAGGFLGGTYGGVPGAAVGSALGHKLSQIVGFGDYAISKNSIAKGTTVPQFVPNGGGLRIAHREFIGDVAGSVGFQIQSKMPINPGLPRSFPWLSAVAQNFESYVLEGLVYEYRPTSGMIGGSTAALGSIIMATDYNVHNPDFPSKQSMESYEYATQCVPYEKTFHGIECLSKTNPFNTFYIRTSDDFAGEQQMYDVGNFFIATQGMQNTGVVGELWVTYDIAFLKPRITSKPDIPFLLMNSTGCDDTVNILGNVKTFLFSNSWESSTSGIGMASVSGDTLTFNTPGSYFVSFAWDSSTAPITGRCVYILGTVLNDSVHFPTHQDFGSGWSGLGPTNAASLTLAITAEVGDTINVHGASSLTGLTNATCRMYVTPTPSQF